MKQTHHRRFEATSPDGRTFIINGDPEMDEKTLTALGALMDAAYKQHTQKNKGNQMADSFEDYADVRICPRCQDRDMSSRELVCWGCKQELTADGDGDWYAAYQAEQEHRVRPILTPLARAERAIRSAYQLDDTDAIPEIYQPLLGAIQREILETAALIAGLRGGSSIPPRLDT